MACNCSAGGDRRGRMEVELVYVFVSSVLIEPADVCFKSGWLVIYCVGGRSV
jgi:hypothetical protein